MLRLKHALWTAVLLFSLCLPVQSQAAIAFVRAATCEGAAPSCSLTGVGAGDLLVAVVKATGGVISAAPNIGGTPFTLVDTQVSDAGFVSGVYYLENTSGGSLTITATLSGSSSRMWVAEFSGAATSSVLDLSAKTSNVTTTTHSFGTIAAPAANSLVIAALGIDSSSTISAMTSGYVQNDGTGGCTTTGFCPWANKHIWYKIKTDSASESPSATSSVSDSTAAILATFKEAGGGGGGGSTPKGLLTLGCCR